ncbi:MAG: FABP family protein [Alteromonadaceae bacterium]|nr:FABP family protein [Alteromonadaceae bacterium]
MKKTILSIALIISPFTFAQNTIVNGLDFGPLAPLVGTWKTSASSIDVSPGRINSSVGKGGPAVSPFYEIRTFEVAADATNASEQYLVALYYKQEVFRKSDNSKFHDQRGYLIYDKKNDMVYNSYCVPRAVCVLAEGKAGSKMTLTAPKRGVAESSFMNKSATTTDFSMTIEIKDDTFIYSQKIGLNIYGKPFAHTDSGILKKVK